jgi:hypothetical protein
VEAYRTFMAQVSRVAWDLRRSAQDPINGPMRRPLAGCDRSRYIWRLATKEPEGERMIDTLDLFRRLYANAKADS